MISVTHSGGRSALASTARHGCSSPSYDFLPHLGLPFSMLFGCTSHAVPDYGSSPRTFAFRQLDHHHDPTPSFTHAFISPGPSSESAGARMLRLPSPTMTFTFNTLPLRLGVTHWHEFEFQVGLWVVTAWSFPSPPGRVPRCGPQDISRKA
jgi:hypothetical protein